MDAITQDSEQIEETPPPADAEGNKAKPPKRAAVTIKEDQDDDLNGHGGGSESKYRRAQREMSPELKMVQQSEDMALRDMLEKLGAEGGFQIKVARLEPEEFPDPATGKRIRVSGHLKDYDTAIDEADIQKRHGGGKFRLRIMRKDARNSWVFFKERRIEIAGDPRTDDVPRNTPLPTPQAPAPAAPTEAPSVVTKAFDALERQLERERGAPSGEVEGYKLMIEMMGQQLAALRGELAQMRSQPKEPADTFKDNLLNRMMDGETARITALRSQYESQLEQERSSRRDLEERLRDRAERDMTNLRMTHEREISTMRESHLRELGSLKSSHDVALASVKTGNDATIKMLEGQIKTLERDNNELRLEVKELRAKKEKSIVEMAKDLEVVRDALGGDDKEPEGLAGKIGEFLTNPDAIRAAADVVRGPAKPGTQAQQPQQQPGAIVKTPDGQTYRVGQDGKTLTPVKHRTQSPRRSPANPGEPQLPQIDEARVKMVVNFLEVAYGNRNDPATVAQSARSMVSEEILSAIRDHGVDVFMSRVAKLPGSSPLSTQAGRNWLRELGEALVG